MTTNTSNGSPIPFLQRWGKALIVIGIGELVFSTTLLVLAATSYWDEPPAWGQFLDVGLAFSIVVTAIAIDRSAAARVDDQMWRRTYPIATYVPVVTLLLLWLGRHQFDFTFLTGVAWRLWITLYVLPSSRAVWQTSPLLHRPTGDTHTIE